MTSGAAVPWHGLVPDEWLVARGDESVQTKYYRSIKEVGAAVQLATGAASLASCMATWPGWQIGRIVNGLSAGHVLPCHRLLQGRLAPSLKQDINDEIQVHACTLHCYLRCIYYHIHQQFFWESVI